MFAVVKCWPNGFQKFCWTLLARKRYFSSLLQLTLSLSFYGPWLLPGLDFLPVPSRCSLLLPCCGHEMVCSLKHSSVWGTDRVWGSAAIGREAWSYPPGDVSSLGRKSSGFFIVGHTSVQHALTVFSPHWRGSGASKTQVLLSLAWAIHWLVGSFDCLGSAPRREFLGSSWTLAWGLMFMDEWIMVPDTDVPLHSSPEVFGPQVIM